MDVHNLMEDVVIQNVNKLYDEVKKENPAWLSCDCTNCRLDAISYVLNRIPPKYVVSGRGVTHSADDLQDLQLKADIDSLALEGIRTVNSTKRPFHTQKRTDCVANTSHIPSYNFSIFTGSVLDGSNFEPVIGAKVLLKYNGEPVEMIDKTWINPYITCKSTKGSYTFWMKSLPAEKEGISKKFNFTLEITASSYAPTTYHFEVSCTSDAYIKNELDSTFSLKLKDLIIFKENIINPMEN
ncbi:MAG: late competence development ComFB family protein [Treponema sp.]|nr:late competence development ComFB family protein [Treponema sp.]